MTLVESRLAAGPPIGAVLLFQIYASIQCSVPLLIFPLALIFMVIPTGVVYWLFFNYANPLPVIAGVASMFPLYYLAYRADCVDVSAGAGTAFGAILPWLFGIPLGLLIASLTR